MKYWNNLCYILQHKWYVLLECWKEGLYWQGILHDMSKFSLTEFLAYAKRFHHEQETSSEQVAQDETAFQYAWLHHQHHNKHHWNYWVVNQVRQEAVPMPQKYLVEMVCDWKAMARKGKISHTEHYRNHAQNLILHPETRRQLDSIMKKEETREQ